jgi:cyclophilin family peptidyl-prolyl cis-trans isomerase
MTDAVPTADELPKHCYMDISVAGSPPETIVFELDTTTCPKTCHNFVSLCAAPGKAVKPKGRANSSVTTLAIATYRNTEFHRIIKGFMAQGGDFENFDGTGGRSIYSTTTFQDESFANKHSSEGTLSMANRGKHTNSSQFFITLGNASHLDGKHVAFGRVVRGMDVVRQMATVETDARDKPVLMQRIVIVDCGVGMNNINSSSKGDEQKLGDKKLKKEKKHRKHSRRDRSNSSSSSSSADSHHRQRPKKYKKRKRERSRSRSRDRQHSSGSKRHSHKERERTKKKYKHSSRHRERDGDRKNKRRSRSRSR